MTEGKDRRPTVRLHIRRFLWFRREFLPFCYVPGFRDCPAHFGVLSHVVPESVSVSVSTREPPVLTCVNPEAPRWLARNETPFFSQLSPAAVAGTHGDRGSLFSFLIVCLHVCGLCYHQKTMVLKVKRWQPPIFHFFSSVRGEPLFTEMVR